MSTSSVECESCGSTNPADVPYCRHCGTPLLASFREGPTARSRSMQQFSQLVGGVRPPRRQRAGYGRAVRTAAAVISLALVLVLSVFLLRSLGFFGSPPGSAGTSGTRTDLCPSPPGPGCAGSQISLPFLASGREQNVSLCESIVPKGSASHFFLKFTTSTGMYGVIVPSALYWGANLSLSANPAGFFNNPASLSDSAWDSGFVSGPQSIDIPIPSLFPQWCVAWWDPGAPGTVTFNSDANLTA